MVKGRLIALSLVTATFSPASANDALISSSYPSLVAELMQKKGLKAELGMDEGGNPQIITGLAGHRVNVWFYDCMEARDCHSIQLQAGLITTQKLTLEAVNQFNQSHQFATLTLDEDQDPILRHDVWMPPPGISEQSFLNTLQAFGKGLEAMWALVKQAESAR